MRSIFYVLWVRSRYRLAQLFRRPAVDLTSACWAPLFGRRSGMDLEAMRTGEEIGASSSSVSRPSASSLNCRACGVLYLPVAGYSDPKERGYCSTCRWEEDMSDIVGTRTGVARPTTRKPLPAKVASVNRVRRMIR